MIQPRQVTITDGSAYIRYTPEKLPVVETREILSGGSVASDLDAEGRIIGIEILDVTEASQLSAVREYARTNDLAFPRDLAGAIAIA